MKAAKANGNGTADGARAISLWRHADFLKLWSAETISQFGTQITVLALPFTAITILHANAFEVGLLTTMEFLPFIIVGLPAGVWVDRLPRRPILIIGDLARALLLGSIPLTYALDVLHIWQLYLVAFLTGICTVFFDVAYQSYLPSLVGRDQLIEGNAKLEVSRATAQLAGPGVGGLLIQVLKAPIAILVDAVSYLWSASWVFFIHAKEPPIEVPADGQPRMRTQIAEGLGYVWHHALLRPIAFCTANSNLWSSMAMAVTILFAVQVLDLGAGAVGLIFAFGTAGGLLGAIVAGRVAKAVGVGPTIVGAAVTFGIPGVLIPLATPTTAWPVLIGAFALFGLGGVIYNINQVSLRQAITPARMQGRMNASMRFMVWGTMPIGSFIGGILGNTIGLRPTLWVAAIGGLFSFVPPLLSPVRSLERIPEAAEEEAPVTPEDALVALETDEGGIVERGQIPRP